MTVTHVIVGPDSWVAKTIESSHEKRTLALCGLKSFTHTCAGSQKGQRYDSFLSEPFLVPFRCERTAKAVERLLIRAGSPEPSLFAYVISSPFRWAGSILIQLCTNVILKWPVSDALGVNPNAIWMLEIPLRNANVQAKKNKHFSKKVARRLVSNIPLICYL